VGVVGLGFWPKYSFQVMSGRHIAVIKPPRSREIRETLRRIAAKQNGHHENFKVKRQSLLAVNA